MSQLSLDRLLHMYLHFVAWKEVSTNKKSPYTTYLYYGRCLRLQGADLYLRSVELELGEGFCA
jgi:hypothetical protein